METYRALAEERLQPLLQQTQRDVDSLTKERQDVRDLLSQLEDMARHAAEASPGRDYKLLAELGEGFHVAARVAHRDLDRIAILVGADVYVELSAAEAIEYSRRRVLMLDESIRKKQGHLEQLYADMLVAKAALQAMHRP